MKKTLLNTAITAALISVSAAQAEQIRVQVSIENLAPQQGTFQTPVWVGFHDGSFDIYDRNQPASALPEPGSDALERIAEDGNTGPITQVFAQLVLDGVDATLAGPGGPIAPGEVARGNFLLDSSNPDHRYFSYASMVIPSNDFFIANGNPLAHPIFDAAGNLIAENFFVTGAEILDAGTEVNDELPENTAFFGQAAADTGVDEGGVVIGLDEGLLGFASPDSRLDPPTILGTPRFSMADFVVPGYPAVKISFSSIPAIVDELTFSAALNGRREVPRADTLAVGAATYYLEDEGTRLTFEHNFRRLNGVTMAHLHLGAEGENGPVVAFLFDPATFEELGTTRELSGELTEQDLVGPLQNQPLDALVQEILDANVYINIHTEAFPGGEIRGQLLLAR